MARNIRVPQEIADAVTRFRRGKLSGLLTISFVAGKPDSVRLLTEDNLQSSRALHYPQERKSAMEQKHG